MKTTPKPGDTHIHTFTVTESKTVPRLYPESAEFRAMPEVFATGFMVGLMEWACIEALRPHLDVGEGSLGVGIAVSHVAATPPGMQVTVTATCLSVEPRRVSWHVRAEDGLDLIGEGTHDRAVVAWERFNRLLKNPRMRPLSPSRQPKMAVVAAFFAALAATLPEFAGFPADSGHGQAAAISLGSLTRL